MPFRCGGIQSFYNLLEISFWMDAEMVTCIPSGTPYLYLQRMVVDPGMQGKGIGTKCLSKAVEKADLQKIHIVLTTQSEDNVRFYKKLGFNEVKQSTYSNYWNPNISFTSYFMVRPPKEQILFLSWLINEEEDKNYHHLLESFVVIKFLSLPAEVFEALNSIAFENNHTINSLDSSSSSTFFSITITSEETSVILSEKNFTILSNKFPELNVLIERDWVAFKICGTLEFSLVGVLANISLVLANSNISIFASSTYNTDYILLKSSNALLAQEKLIDSGKYKFTKNV